MGNSRNHGRGAGGPAGQDQAADIHAALVSATSQELKCDLFEYTRLPLRSRERLWEEEVGEGEEEGEEGAAQPPRGTGVWQAKAGLSWGCSDVICAPVGDRGEPTPPTPAGAWKSPNFPQERGLQGAGRGCGEGGERGLEDGAEMV